jgi:hypothetical protein
MGTLLKESFHHETASVLSQVHQEGDIAHAPLPVGLHTAYCLEINA